MYPPIGDYAVIGDSRCAALVSRAGSIDWLCLPHFSGSAVFAAMLDSERGGRFALQPTDGFTAERNYVGDTNVLQTTFATATGSARLTDAMPLPSDSERLRSLQPQRELLRIVECTNGEIELQAEYAPRPDFGRARTRLSARGKFGWSCEHRDELLLLNSDLAFATEGDGSTLRARFRLQEGEKRHLSLTYAQRDIAVAMPLGGHADDRLAATLDWWRSWSDRCTYRGRYRAAVMRSALALKLLTYALSGAVVAAPTTSLPEAIGGSRNWDYRFCWLRDAAFTLESFADLGYELETQAFMDWLLHATRLTQPELQVLYDVHGESDLREESLDHLHGYRGSRPVRAGNGAHDQLQLDVYGEVVMAATYFVMRGGELARDEAKMLIGLGRTVCKRWREPDHGIWEIRGEPKHYTHSKLMCWAALDCLLKVRDKLAVSAPYDEFDRERSALEAAIESRGYSTRRQSYVDVLDGDAPDASLLLMARSGYRDAAHSRLATTFGFIDKELACDALVYRYRPGTDGMDGREGAFVACGFWAAEYLARSGRIDEAHRRMESMLSCANDVGLLAEEVDVGTFAAVGNFPQAFSHIGLITAALAIANAESS